MANRQAEKMMKNKYQWQVKDMRKAGLNPILAATQGPPLASSHMAQMPDLGNTVNSAMQAQTAHDQMQANVQKINAEIEQLVQQADLTSAQKMNVIKLTSKIQEEVRQLDSTNEILEVINQFKADHPEATIAQAFGLDARTLADALSGIFKKVFGNINIKGKQNGYVKRNGYTKTRPQTMSYD
jgi:vacuolar-type H+-ATPase subunit I/STV1